MNNQHLINFLNQLLSNYWVLYVKLHRYHWYVQGRHFFQLHDKFEEMYTAFADDIDTLAERIIMIDGQPLATMVKYVKEATLTEANADNEEDEMIAQLISDLNQIISEIKTDGMKYVSEVDDEPTLDLLVTFQGKLEKYVWMFNAYGENL